MDKKKVLGKGLSALIPEGDINRGFIDKEPTGIVYLNTSELKPSRYQPREEFNDGRLQELVSSVKEKGFLQPILVRRVADGYELIAGERRLRAARALGMSEVPAIIKSVSEEDSLVLSIIENVQREELNPMEEAHAFQRLIDEFNFTQEHVAQSVGKDRSTVANTLRLLNLPQDIQDAVSRGTITMGHARCLLSLDNGPEQSELFKKALANSLSVRELENLIKTKSKRPAKRIRDERKEPFLLAAEEALQHTLATKVRIFQGKKRGKILIEYYSKDELNRIIDIIRR
ncbi:MAG: ParB/RepB/Spo0J family partition protein [Candidatus Omnitrophica bacterium]|nr:ParB/RepB/Spo0J family partition protein [Candidatus Omnitrophota bacterium]